MISDTPIPAGDEASELFAMAALRQSFEPSALLDEWLTRFPDASHEQQLDASDAVFDLTSMCVPVQDLAGKEALSLPEETRLSILTALDAGTARALLAAAPESAATSTEQMLGTLLSGAAVPVNPDSYPELSTLLSATRWANAIGIAPALQPEALETQMRRVNFIHALGGSDLPRFVGRETLLARWNRNWAEQQDRLRCIALQGPGGIGKSLLVTRFVADLLEADGDLAPDAVYHLDFDQVALQSARPMTIWRALIQQSKSWCDAGLHGELEELTHRLPKNEMSAESESDISRSSEGRDMGDIAYELLRAISPGKPARLIIFADSFEQVEGFDDVAAGSVFAVAEVLARFDVKVLLIVASRTHGEHPGRYAKTYHLRQLSEDEAIDYLIVQARGCDVAINRQKARQVLQVAGRSPLALRLAVGLLEKGDKMAPDEWAAQVVSSPEIVQAALYERLLRRLRSAQLRKVAAPGLLVRRLSTEVITEVLAIPCELDLNETSARSLMQAARSEGQLFTSRADDPDGLWHRADVRSNMLRNVQRYANADVAADIHQRAIDYYARHDTPLHRLEELYHRLCLDQDAALIDPRWQDSANAGLRRCIADFPARAAAYLRRRMGAATIDPYAPVGAAPGEVAQVSELQSDEYMRHSRKQLRATGETSQIITQWRESGQDLGGEFGAIVAAALVQNGAHEELLAGARDLLALPQPEDPVAACAVLRQAAAILEGRGLLAQAFDFWRAASQLAVGGQDFNGELAALVGLLRTERKLNDTEGSGESMERALVLLVNRGKQLREQLVLAREATAELGLAALRSGGAFDRIIMQLLNDLLSSNEAFPEAQQNKARTVELNERLSGTPGSTSIRELVSIGLRLLFAPNSGMTALIRTLREEVDLTLIRGAWPRKI